MSQARDLGDAANFLDNVTSDIQPQLTPAGTIIAFGGATAPTGYLACDGSGYLKSEYPDLWAAIGDTWGASTTSLFTVPDLRGAFLRGTGSHGTSNMANGNDFAGPSVGDFENDQMQQHGHNLDVGGGDVNDYLGGSNAAYGIDAIYVNNELNRTIGEISSHAYDGTPRVGDETRPFNAGVMYCIKT